MTNVVNTVSDGSSTFDLNMENDHNSGHHRCRYETYDDSLINKSQEIPFEESLVNKSCEKPTEVLL